MIWCDRNTPQVDIPSGTGRFEEARVSLTFRSYEEMERYRVKPQRFTVVLKDGRRIDGEDVEVIEFEGPFQGPVQ